jgi:DNA-binding CsgD family transcriptional regulator
MKNVTTHQGTCNTPSPRRIVSVVPDSKVDCDEVAQVDIDGQTYTLLCVDAVIARRPAQRDAGRARLTFVSGEAANFELNGHSYSLVPSSALESAAATDEHDPVQLTPNIHALLTNRELQIVQLICVGLLTKQVASRLRISEFTVRSYLKTIYCKLGVRSRGAMVFRYAQAINRHPGEG